jgi:hypothetical protein
VASLLFHYLQTSLNEKPVFVLTLFTLFESNKENLSCPLLGSINYAGFCHTHICPASNLTSLGSEQDVLKVKLDIMRYVRHAEFVFLIHLKLEI